MSHRLQKSARHFQALEIRFVLPLVVDRAYAAINDAEVEMLRFAGQIILQSRCKREVIAHVIDNRYDLVMRRSIAEAHFTDIEILGDICRVITAVR